MDASVTPSRVSIALLVLALSAVGCSRSEDSPRALDQSHDMTWQEYAAARRSDQLDEDIQAMSTSRSSSAEVGATDADAPAPDATTLAESSGIPQAKYPGEAPAEATLAAVSRSTTSAGLLDAAPPSNATAIIEESKTSAAASEESLALPRAELVRLPAVSHQLPTPQVEPLPTISAPAQAVTQVDSTLIPAPFFANDSQAELVAVTGPVLDAASASVVATSSDATSEVQGSRDTQVSLFSGNWVQLLQEEQPQTVEAPLMELDPQVAMTLRLPPEMTRRANEMMEHATALAERGALFSARVEFLRVLRLVAQALDSELGYRHHTRALATGLQALDEADDFATRGVSAASDLQVAGYVAGHRTPVIKQANLDTYTPITAMQAYYEYAMQHLRMAGNHEQVASLALYGLGQVDMRMTQQNGKATGGGPTPVAFFQTALAIDPTNADAANELGVLMARYGQWDQAAKYLEQSLSVKQTPIVAANLAEVRRRQGTGMLSMQPRPMTDSQHVAADLTNQIQWVDPSTFARAGAGAGPSTSIAALPHASAHLMPNSTGEPTPAIRPRPHTTSAIPQHPMSGFAQPQPVHGDSAAAAARGVSDWFRR